MNTIAHELSHQRNFLNGRWATEVHGGPSSLADGTPCGSGNASQIGGEVSDDDSYSEEGFAS